MSLKEKLVEVCHKVYEKGFVAAYDGNLSVRTDNNSVLITRSCKCKGEITVNDLIEIDLNGNVLNGEGKISTENKIHLLAYSKREDVNAVVHCHPVYATAFALIGEGLIEHYLPEVVLTLGRIPLCKFAIPSTDEVPESMSPYIDYSWAMLLENHGAVTFGKDIFDAYYKMEKLEHAAKIIFLAKKIGKLEKLTDDVVNKLFEMAEKTYGLKQDKRNIF
ncbi:MAG: class II aldolase/adducin family protein [Ignavibacteriaceae bacterium]|nr:class II aldolase/adducin family protein [Ignavibacteriaceae bacterium]